MVEVVAHTCPDGRLQAVEADGRDLGLGGWQPCSAAAAAADTALAADRDRHGRLGEDTMPADTEQDWIC